jgi:hypothetical protein
MTIFFALMTIFLIPVFYILVIRRLYDCYTIVILWLCDCYTEQPHLYLI